MVRRSDPGGARRDDGIMIVEAAIVFPLLLLLTFGVIEYGWLFIKFQHITNAARAGARAGVRADAVNADVTAEVKRLLNDEKITTYTVTLQPASVDAPATGEPVKVTVTVPYASIGLLRIPLIPVPADLRSSVTMAKEGP